MIPPAPAPISVPSASRPVTPRAADRRALQRIAAAAVRLDAWNLPFVRPVDHPTFVMVRRDRYDALARACSAYLEAEE